MKRTYCLTAAIVLVASTSSWGAEPPHRALTAPAIGDVRIADAFWAPRIRTCREVTLPYAFQVCERTGRISNFVKAAGRMEGKFEGIWFNDSDVYKVLQGAACELGAQHDPELDKLTDEVIAKIAAAQQSNGYLFCFFTIDQTDQRFRNIHPTARHELYCMGHMIEAGAVHFEQTGKRNLLDVARRLADHIDSVFGPDKQMMVPEHQEIELGLIKLYRVTGEQRYLKLARFFIDQRGNDRGHRLYGAYSQDHLPVRQQNEIVGHAVRAMYNCVGMADLYMETGDRELLTALHQLWQSTTRRKMYITGGVGATARGEAFGADYELPNETAYAETCAQIGLVLWAQRMLLIEPHAEFADVMERVLYNSFLSGLSLQGTEFFYQNRLATGGDYRRQAWYGCACCPSNVVRIYPQIGRLMYAADDQSVYLNLYAAGKANLNVGDYSVTLTQETRYPWDGRVKLVVEPQDECTFDLCVRIPGWCRDRHTPGGLYRADDDSAATLSVNGKSLDTKRLDKGYVRIRRRWKQGDVIELELPMPVRRVYAHEKVLADQGRVALQRGPIVYCVEAVDHEVPPQHIYLPKDAPLAAHHRDGLLGGVTVITGKAAVTTADDDKPASIDLLAVPYYAWDNRSGGAMSVWLAEDPQYTTPLPAPTVASRARVSASYCNSSDFLSAINDQIVPPNSHEFKVPRHTFWNHIGSQEWLQYDFAATSRVDAVEVYWFDDRDTGRCWVPETWQLLYRDGGQWQPVTGATPFGTEVDKSNRVMFDPVETDGLRIELKLQKNCSGGVLEWKVHEVP